jgi:hypothetical protein
MALRVGSARALKVALMRSGALVATIIVFNQLVKYICEPAMSSVVRRWAWKRYAGVISRARGAPSTALSAVLDAMPHVTA